MSAENKTNDTITQKLRAIADKWEREAMESVPAAYADRDLEYKYFNLDNEAAGLMRAAEELREVLDSLEDSSGICAKLLLDVVMQGWGSGDEIDTHALNAVARAVDYLAERGLVEITAVMSERYMLARVVEGAPQEQENEAMEFEFEAVKFMREVAHVSNDALLRIRALALLKKYGHA